ncbi:FtsQ-type POTRA domain-containing protein [Microbacterium yannicii]|uniref:FtsQ-type POTRA domain-containing protein n=1 Tax=Microbacterium yannicii TaxID=671622 RepID=A0ABP9MNS7_9MICO|nr:FtsQ-type POTRA domain-containing protein [Microbacterium yannicii]MCO5951615.1 FtsQ-type POTRA domain-containing protein [Microbacterium yannicii]
MRRPSPLPQSPVASRGVAGAAVPGRPAPDDRSREPRSSGVAESEHPEALPVDEHETAPVIPLSPATAPPDTASATDAGRMPGTEKSPRAKAPRDKAGAGRTPDAGDVGFREVWKASRARRKALRAEIRRFTVRQRRRRAIWLGVAASLVLLALGTIGAAYSPLFGVEKISVVGAQQLPADDVADALSGQLGTPLPLVDESAVKAELVAFPLIETYALEARPPHELVVRIVERTPIGLIETRAGYTLVDAAGVALSTSGSGAPSPGTPLLTVTGGVDSDAFAAAGQVMRSLPDDIRAQVTEVTASTPDDVTLTLGGSNAQVVWGSAEQSARKAMVLATAMAARPPADVVSYDVSSPDAIVIR